MKPDGVRDLLCRATGSEPVGLRNLGNTCLGSCDSSSDLCSGWGAASMMRGASLMLLCSPWRMLLSSLSSSFEGPKLGEKRLAGLLTAFVPRGDLKQISIRPIRWAQGGSPWHDVARVQRPACNLSRCTKALGVARCTLANAGP